ncbi:MAG: DoxX family protein [Moraxella sp.]|uniref:HvfX family Cu-binding RiPP maturation protein n=1 Tax=Moraxella sp. TaxID=479 RepID=UPI0026DA8921|nr:DoxX family protein [Moraxella sp.]MDO4450613.1 DoxX family protein [Moraxella sp.]
MIKKFTHHYLVLTDRLKSFDVLALFVIRLYLAPVFIMAGLNKYQNFESTVNWFGNSEWGLGLPFASFWVVVVIIAELVGGVALLFGLATRLFGIMLAITMAVAMMTVHLKNGWHAITPTDPSTSIAQLFGGFGQASLDNSVQAAQRLNKAREILQTHGNYDWLTETGNFVILNNGIEFGMTYFIMLLVLIIYGAGRFLSIDYWVFKKVNNDK